MDNERCSRLSDTVSQDALAGSMQPTFSIIIPTYARPEQLSACLHAIVNLKYPRHLFDVVVVDDGSPVPLGPEVKAFARSLRLSVMRQSNAGPGAARNLGAGRATGEYLAFTADDCTPQADWLDALARGLSQYPGRLLGGYIEHALPRNLYATASHLLIDYLYTYYNSSPKAATFFTPNNMVVPANLFKSIGGFDTTTGTTGEDREFCHRWRDKGYLMAYVPEAVIRHSHPLTFSTFIRQQYAYGIGSAKYRKLLAARSSRAFETTKQIPEPFKFYVNLILHPLKYGKGAHAWTQVGLLVVSQIANAIGVVIESCLNTRDGREPGNSSRV